MSNFRWRVTASNLRWVLLASVGGIVHACGGRAEIEDLDGIDGDGGAAGAQGGRAARGGAGGSVMGRGGYGAGGYGGYSGAAMAGAAGSAMTGAAGSGFAGSYNYPQPYYYGCDYVVADDNGWVTCNNGVVYRYTGGVCASYVPRPYDVPPEVMDGGIDPSVACYGDGDCNDGIYGHCEEAGTLAARCEYGCIVDAQCGFGQLCLCEYPVGRCITALDCTSNNDCNYGLMCTGYSSSPGGRIAGMACQSYEDECGSDLHCGASQNCYPSSPSRRCVTWVDGRPFLIDGEARVASTCTRPDWCDASLGAASAAEPELSAALAAAFTRQGSMEHASIAAFARFSLQLLALGAPPELVSAAARAMQDETRHAQACFALASRHAGAAVGPGPLPLEGALADTSWLGVVRDTILEGCIGETAAALEAAEAAAHCADPDTRRVLLDIAREEAQHAELAWRFVRWALTHGPRDLHVHVVDVLRAALGPAAEGMEAPALSTHQQALLENGVLCDPLRSAVRVRALEEVVRPCVTALFQSALAGTTGPASAELHPALVA